MERRAGLYFGLDVRDPSSAGPPSILTMTIGFWAFAIL